MKLYVKPSKFNFFMRDEKNELLLYNSLVGVNSFSKVKEGQCDKVEEVLSSAKMDIAENDSLMMALYKKGFLVIHDKDEDKVLRNRALNLMAKGYLHLTIFPTGQCNFRCKYCCESFEQGKMDQTTQTRIVKYLEKNLRFYSGLQIDWFGGEPLLGFDVIKNISREAMRICNNLKKPYISSMTSNGYFLSFATFLELLKCRVFFYTITIDGLEEEHNFYRGLANGKESYKIVLNNLIEIKEKCKSRLFKINIRTNFTREMYDKLDDYIDFYSNIFQDERFSFVVKAAMDWGGDTIESVKNSLLTENELKKIYTRLIETKKMKNFDFLKAFYEFGGCICSAGHLNGYVLDTYANIYKCSRIDYENFKIGAIGDGGEWKVNEEKECEWINPFITGTHSALISCQNTDCAFMPICMGEPCAKHRILQDGHESCPFEIKNIEYLFKLLNLDERNFEYLI